MSHRPQEDSIYTLQRRIGTQRQLSDPRVESETVQAAAAENHRPGPGTSTLGKLFAWRLRAA